ncbi:MAG: hypothetical protein ABSH41_32210 [Syntrophobacteraceae bacterium]
MSFFVIRFVIVFTRPDAEGALAVYNFVIEARQPLYSAGPVFQKAAIGSNRSLPVTARNSRNTWDG